MTALHVIMLIPYSYYLNKHLPQGGIAHEQKCWLNYVKTCLKPLKFKHLVDYVVCQTQNITVKIFSTVLIFIPSMKTTKTKSPVTISVQNINVLYSKRRQEPLSLKKNFVIKMRILVMKVRSENSFFLSSRKNTNSQVIAKKISYAFKIKV